MKKITLLTATALTLASFGAQSITTLAASQRISCSIPKRNRVIYAYGCNAQDILAQLKDCFPEITLPDCELPGTNIPETNIPGNDNTNGNVTPEVDTTPETDTAPDTDTTPETDTAPEEDEAPENGEHAYIQQIVDLVNNERAKEGLSPLTLDTKVKAAASVRAKECEQLFSHTRPNGSSFSTALKEQNVSYRSAGENIAWGQRSPEEVMKGWMNSSGHRANIMNPNFTTIGVGYYQNANGTNYWCQLFTR